MANLRVPPLSKPEDWPDLDKDAWRAAVNDDVLAPGSGGGASAWREATLRFTEQGYGGWLGWLEATGQLNAGEDPGLRATGKRVTAYYAMLEKAGLSGHTRATRLQGLADALRVMRPDQDFRFISVASGRVRAISKSSRDLRARFRHPSEIVKCGLDKIRAAENGGEITSLQRAVLHRDGLLLAFWVMTSLRASNLSGINVGRELRRCGNDFRIEFAPAVMKGGRTLVFTWPASITPALRTYLDIHRPVLLTAGAGKGEDALWLSAQGGAMSSGTISQLLYRITARAFGIGINAHTVRHLNATYLAEAFPENIMDVPAILNHRSHETAEKYYLLARGRRASAAFHEALADRYDLDRPMYRRRRRA